MDMHHTAGHFHLISVVLSTVLMSSFTDGDIKFKLSGRCVGRVELSNGTRVCSDNWSLTKANAVCAQLRCGKAVAAGMWSLEPGSGNIWLNDFSCNNDLSKCTVTRSGSTCSKSDAGAVCSGGISKPTVSTLPSGEVQWGSSIEISCSVPDEIHKLTKGTFKIMQSSVDQETKVTQMSQRFVLRPVTFEDEGQYDCCYNPKQSSMLCSPVDFTVTVDLPAPNISVSALDEPPRSRDSLRVTRGYGFVVVCSTLANSPEGLFLLWFSGSNGSVTEPAVSHSASFHFPESQSEHQGEYRCVHQVTGAGRTYTSPPSAAAQVTVTSSLLPVVLPVTVVGLLLILLLIGGYFCYRRRRKRVTVTELSATTPSARTTNQYEEDDDDDDVDYVNVTPPGACVDKERQNDPYEDDDDDYVNVSTPEVCVDKERQNNPSDAEDDDDVYVNVTVSHNGNNPDSNKEEESIYQNYQFTG